MMKQLSFLLLPLGLVAFVVNALGQPSQAQTGKDEQVTYTIRIQKPEKEPIEFSIRGTPNRATSASIVGVLTIGAGIEIDAAQTGINFTLAGADPDAVSNLILSLGGMIQDNVVDLTRLALAINAFNTIVDKADLDTLTALKALPEFVDIQTLLVELRKPIG
jgi:hypothetical protein